MEAFAGSGSSAHVVIAGGGFAAVETLLALRALGSERVGVTLVAPAPTLFYRPAATAEAFEEDAPTTYDLQAIASELGAAFTKARLVFVGSEKRYVRLSSGARLTYDALVVATGARATAGVPGALMFRDQRDVPAFRRVLSEIDNGTVRRIVFAVPAGQSWSLPIYELALLSATRARERHLHADVTLVTPEQAPLAVFGSEPSRLVENLLAERGVSFVGDSVPDHVCDDGSLALASGQTIEADRVLAIPQLSGRPIRGVPTNRAGLVPTDASGRVQGLTHVYAAGDVTAFPVKQGGVASQQADRVAQAILTAVGAPLVGRRIPNVLQARLIGGARPLFLRAELDEHGRATSATLTRTASEESIVEHKVLARFLTPYLEEIGSAASVQN
jgi:sulfide:quinone oxidoreductase